MGNKYTVIFDKDCLDVDFNQSIYCDKFQILIDDDHNAYLKLFFRNNSNNAIKKISVDVNLYNSFDDMIGVEENVEIVLDEKSPSKVFSNEELIPINNMVRMVSAVIKNVENNEIKVREEIKEDDLSLEEILEEKKEETKKEKKSKKSKEVKEEKPVEENKPVIDAPVNNVSEDTVEAFNFDLLEIKEHELSQSRTTNVEISNDDSPIIYESEIIKDEEKSKKNKKENQETAVFKDRDFAMQENEKFFAKEEKKKKTKKGVVIALIAIFVAAIIVTSVLVPLKVINKNGLKSIEAQLEDFEYHTNGSQIIIEKYKNIPEDGVVVIPKGVTGIQYNAFNSCNELSSIVIPDTVTNIEMGAFMNCSKLESVQLSNNISSINSYTFYNCTDLKDITIPLSVNTIASCAFQGCKSLTKIDLTSVTSIGDSAFLDCCNLVEATLGTGLEYISPYTFSNCVSLGTIEIPNTVSAIGMGAFEGCESLTRIIIPNSVTSIEESAFQFCYNLTSITYYGSQSSWDNISIEYGNDMLRNANITYIMPSDVSPLVYTLNTNRDGYIVSGETTYKNSQQISIPSNYNGLPVVAIASYGFRNYSMLEDIDIPQTVQSIGEAAFLECHKLKEIEIPQGVTEIEKSTFAMCEKLTSVALPNGITTIGDHAFYCCGMTHLTLPNSVKTIESGAFSMCAIVTIYIGDYAINAQSDIFSDCYSIAYSEYENAYYIGNAFNSFALLVKAKNTNITTCSIANDCKSIAKGAFKDCTNLTTLSIPDTVEIIGDSAFEGCTNLSSVQYGSTMARLEQITGTDNDCLFNANIECVENFEYEISSDGKYYILSDVKQEYTTLKEYVIPSKYNKLPVKEIKAFAFVECQNLESLSIPQSIIKIGDSAFRTCNNLKTVNYNGTKNDWENVEIGSNNTPLLNASFTFAEIFNFEINSLGNGYIVRGVKPEYQSLKKLEIPDYYNGLPVVEVGNGSCSGYFQDLVIGDNVKTIGDYAFNMCRLKHITIGASVQSIGYCAFAGNNDLAFITNKSSMTFDISHSSAWAYGIQWDNIKEVATKEDSHFIIDENDFAIYSNYSEIVLVGYYGDKKEITIPEGVTEIGSGAFIDSDKINSIEISSSVTTIRTNAFNIPSLIKLTIGENVNIIENDAFNGCSGLISIYNKSRLSIEMGSSNHGNVAQYAKEIYSNETDSKLTINSDGYIIYSENDGAILLGYCGDSKDLILPNEIVTIGDQCFYESDIETILIPTNVKSIGRLAFYRCEELKVVTLNEGLEYIGEYAFFECLTLQTITIPSTVTQISEAVFVGCSELETITFNTEKITKIERATFTRCEKLRQIIIPDGVESIGSEAFANCYKLYDITIPTSVHSIGVSAFAWSEGIESVGYLGSVEEWSQIIIESGNENLLNANIRYEIVRDVDKLEYQYDSSKNGYIVTAMKEEYKATCTSIEIPTIYQGMNVVKVSDDAFDGCTNLLHITVYSSTECNPPFDGCNALVTLNWGTEIYLINADGTATYVYCNQPDINEGFISSTIGIKNIPVTSIAADAFCNCSNLSTINIPASIKNIESRAFYGCNNLTTVIYYGSEQQWNLITIEQDNECLLNANIEFNYVTIEEKLTFTLNNTEDGYVVTGVKAEYLNITSIEIPNTYLGLPVVQIGNSAFESCSSLTSVVIPNTVTSIGSRAFALCGKLESITLPNGLTTISSYQFIGCTELKTIILPSSITNIESSAFDGCDNLTSVYYLGTQEEWNEITIQDSTIQNATIYYNNPADEDKLTYELNSASNGYIVKGFKDEYKNSSSVVIPMLHDGLPVTSIGYYAFDGCTSLTNVTIPNTVTSIMDCAFQNCKNLTSITIPNSVTTIKNAAFYDCFSLTSITIPKGVTYIGNSAFIGCYSVTSITVEEGNSVYHSAGNCVIETAAKKLVVGCKNSVIPTDGSVTIIGEYSFMDCNELTNIVIPSNITTICDSAFHCCIGLTNVTIPNSVTSIERYAFFGCNNLISITIPNSVTSIGESAFDNCTSLQTVNYTGTQENWNSISIDVLNEYLTNATINYDYVLGEDKLTYSMHATTYGYIVTGLKDEYKDSTSIIIPMLHDGLPVTSIGNYAFQGCTNLTNVTISNSVTSIGMYAFDNCIMLLTPVIPDSVTSIGECAFRNCDNITSISLPFQVTQIGQGTFKDCEMLHTITIKGEIVEIGYGAFENCSSLTSIIIPHTVTNIGNDAFSGCTSLSTVYYSETVEEWNYINIGTGNECLTNATIYFNNPVDEDKLNYELNSTNDGYIVKGFKDEYKNSTSVVIPMAHDGLLVTGIGNYAFSGCTSLTSLTISNSVSSIGVDAFKTCNNLTSIVVEEGNAIYHSSGNCLIETASKTLILGCSTSVIPTDGSVTNIGYAAFEVCVQLKSITIPNGVTSIGDRAFNCCTGLTSITIPNSVLSIGDRAFDCCTGLTSITIPNSVTSIGIAAFHGCDKVTIINVEEGNSAYHSDGNCLIETASKTLIFGCSSSIIPTDGSVTSISDYAFQSCTNLTSITIPNSVTNIGYAAFYGCSGLTSITIPNSVTSIGEYAFSGCNGLVSITVEQGNSVYHSDGNCLIETASKTLIFGCSSSIIPTDGSVTSIGKAAFENCFNLTSIIIPQSVICIGESAFYGCNNLTSVYYLGTQEEWNEITMQDTTIQNVTVYYYSETQPAGTGNYWHYDTDGVTPIKW